MHDYHPLRNMSPLPGEAKYNENLTIILENRYFSDEPWIKNSGMSYISGEYESKEFINFLHSISKIINGIINSEIEIAKFDEFDYYIGLGDIYDNKGMPLSMIVVGIKK